MNAIISLFGDKAPSYPSSNVSRESVCSESSLEENIDTISEEDDEIESEQKQCYGCIWIRAISNIFGDGSWIKSSPHTNWDNRVFGQKCSDETTYRVRSCSLRSRDSCLSLTTGKIKVKANNGENFQDAWIEDNCFCLERISDPYFPEIDCINISNVFQVRKSNAKHQLTLFFQGESSQITSIALEFESAKEIEEMFTWISTVLKNAGLTFTVQSW